MTPGGAGESGRCYQALVESASHQSGPVLLTDLKQEDGGIKDKSPASTYMYVKS